MLAAIGIAEPQSAEYAFDEDNAAQDVGSTSKARFGPRDLREGKTSLTQYPKILHAEYPLGEAFDIADEAQSENDVPKLVVAGHVAPPVEQGAYKIKFLQLGRPPAYSRSNFINNQVARSTSANAASYRFGLDGIWRLWF
jgi:hypothetical protein